MSAAAASFGDAKRAASPNKSRIDLKEPPRLLIGGAPHHHAVDMVKMRAAASTLAMPPLSTTVRRGCAALSR